MKKLLSILICIFISGALIAQTFSLESCDRFTNKNTNMYKSAVFNTVGINLNKYDWKEPTLNCHINSTMYYGKKASGKKIGAIVAVAVGGTFIIGGAPLLGTWSSGIGGGLFGLGLACVGGSVPLFIFAKKDKRKMNYHLDQVSEYYRTNNMF